MDEISKYLQDRRQRLESNIGESFEKGNNSGLVQKKIWVTRNGTPFQKTVWVRPEDASSTPNQAKNVPVGDSIGETKGMDIRRYSEKAILISGDTYANKDTMKAIKSEIGVGSYNGKLKGWVYPVKYLSEVLGMLFSKTEDPDKAEAIKNQKNELPAGTEISIDGQSGTITEGASTDKGTKYNVTIGNETREGVDEKVISTTPLSDDEEIAEINNNTTASNRASSTKRIYGIKEINDIHKYSLKDYMSLHGIEQHEIDLAIAKLINKKEPSKTSSSSSSTTSTKESSEPQSEPQGLTRQQLISKLVFKHYQAVKAAIDNGATLNDNVVSTYPDLKEDIKKQRQAMSEETKRKISEALKKNGPDEDDKKAKAQAAVEEFINAMPEAELEKLKDSFKQGVSDFVKKEQETLATLVAQNEVIQKKIYKLKEQENEATDYKQKSNLSITRMKLRGSMIPIETKIAKQKNIVAAVSKGGLLVEMTDLTGVKHERIPDFSSIKTESIVIDEETILNDVRPDYIPEIDRDKFRSKSFIFDSIKVGPNKYMIATTAYAENPPKVGIQGSRDFKDNSYDPDYPGYVTLTLDQLVLTQDYYTKLEKAEMRKQADERNQRGIEQWNRMPDERKEKFLMQKYMYNSIPAKEKKKITEADYNALTWQEREKIYIPVKKHGIKRLKSKFDEKHMAGSFHSMYERFTDKDALRKDKDGKPLARGKSSYGTTYANKAAWDSWQNFRQTLDWKINDINVQREEYSNTRKQALETSYGMSNTNDILKDEYGILVKRQNGEQIKQQHIDEIESAWRDVQGSFGPLVENATKDNLKISHSGTKNMFASKAIGVYYSKQKAIGVSGKLGTDQLGFTLGHEVAHYIDNSVGESQGSRFASDDYDSTAGQLAIKFRSLMNEKTESKYLNSTHECFARALEQYNATKSKGEEALRAGKSTYSASAAYVNNESFKTEIAPLIEKFLEENKTFIKSIQNEL